jgi:hypothetical protein
MSTPVYNQTPTLKNRPVAMKDAQSNVILPSFDWLAYRFDGTYVGLARPGAVEGDLVWQIRMNTYDENDVLTSTTWPENPSGHASADFQFSWTDRASYTYS